MARPSRSQRPPRQVNLGSATYRWESHNTALPTFHVTILRPVAFGDITRIAYDRRKVTNTVTGVPVIRLISKPPPGAGYSR